MMLPNAVQHPASPVRASSMPLNVTPFRGDPEKLWLHIKIGKIFRSLAVFPEELRIRIRVKD
jgi:hypothetical protein